MVYLKTDCANIHAKIAIQRLENGARLFFGSQNQRPTVKVVRNHYDQYHRTKNSEFVDSTVRNAQINLCIVFNLVFLNFKNQLLINDFLKVALDRYRRSLA